jgi:hypothetical protein
MMSSRYERMLLVFVQPNERLHHSRNKVGGIRSVLLPILAHGRIGAKPSAAQTTDEDRRDTSHRRLITALASGRCSTVCGSPAAGASDGYRPLLRIPIRRSLDIPPDPFPFEDIGSVTLRIGFQYLIEDVDELSQTRRLSKRDGETY